MINPNNITFPLTLDTFIALQEAEIGRKISASESDLFTEVVDMANEAYTAASNGNTEAIEILIKTIDAAANTIDGSHNFAALCRGWVRLGYHKGIEQQKSDDYTLN